MTQQYPTSASRFKPEMLPPPQTFYRQEFPRLSRPSKGWARTACPFHRGKNKTAFSVNIETGGFYCFNCGVHGGDVLDFVMLRDHLDFKRAAQSLGAWDESTLTWEERRRIRRERERRQAAQLAELARVERERRSRIEARNWLHTTERCVALASRRLDEIARGSPETFPGEQEACWDLMADFFAMSREADADYRSSSGIEAA